METNNCIVSVIIPTYGRPDCLKRAINSVLSQTFEQVEAIVIDDNNPDTEARLATEQTMSEYADNPKVVYLKHPKNMNGSTARNTGIKEAKGNYLCFLDDDDEMLPNRIEVFVNKMESLDDSWGVCYSNFVKLKDNDEKVYCGESRTGELYREALMRSLFFCPGSNLFARAELVREIGGFDTDFKRNQDLEFLARLLEKSKLAFVPENTLIIHYEGKTGKKMTYEDLVNLDEFYLGKFESRINNLPKKDKKKIYQYFALERLRYSIRKKNLSDGIKNCFKVKVSPIMTVRYCFYILGRLISGKSYGFKL